MRRIRRAEQIGDVVVDQRADELVRVLLHSVFDFLPHRAIGLGGFDPAVDLVLDEEGFQGQPVLALEQLLLLPFEFGPDLLAEIRR